MAKKYKTRLNAQHCEALVRVIGHLAEAVTDATPEEALHLAVLWETADLLRRKMLDYAPAYKVTLTAAQALALRLLYVLYIEPGADVCNDLHNRLMLLSNDIHKTYQL